MADDSDFERLLKEAREWDARDRTRHRASGMNDEGAPDAFPAQPGPPLVTVEELTKREAADLGAPRRAPMLETPGRRPSSAIKVALRTVLKQAKTVQPDARAKPKAGGWGWIVWALVVAYFVFKRYLH